MTSNRIAVRAAFVFAALMPSLASAEVVERGADHFVLRRAVALAGSGELAWRAVGDVGRWWDSAHTYSGDAANMSIQLEPGGCFCEANVNGGVFEHGRVVEADPKTGVRLNAPLGPLKGRATQADLSIGWSGGDRGQDLVMSYVVRGPGMGAFADGVDGVMTIQFDRLVRFIQHGEPAAD
ncbi:hypothetical protein ACO2Q1_05475 [Brevundimonas sp. VNH65]|uniref:hypothetical protein n=1 Tax=Brevundimonas sp. VNH65 TaxID=3400917 RepID=UPI003BFFFD85